MTFKERSNEVLELLEPLIDKGWMANLWFDKEEVYLYSLTGGDRNCPHPKNYDPSDGHGHTYITEHDVDIPEVPDDKYDVEHAKAMIKLANEVEAKPFSEKEIK